MIFWGYFSSIGYGLLCLLLSFVLYRLGVEKKYTRKVVHILVGFEWVFLYHFFGAGVHFLTVCLLFTGLLAISYFAKLLPMISSEGDNSPGTVYYGLAMTAVATVGCFVPEVMLPFGVGIMCTSIGDGLAGAVGQAVRKHNPKVYKNKSLFGSLSAFVFSFLSTLVISLIFKMGLNVWQMLAIALLSASLELIGEWGLDNLSITWGVTALTYAFMYFEGINNYLVPILLTPFVIAFALGKRALTPLATFLAVVMDFVISISLGNFGFLTLVGFFAISIAVDKVKKRAKKNRTYAEAEKSGTRDVAQVLANGLVATLMATSFVISGHFAFVVGFVAALSEALSDTVSSGIGIFANKTYDIFRLKECKRGISGGMSLIGTLSSLLAALLLSSLGLLFGALDLKCFLIASGSAFLGGVFDSFLGSLFQEKRKCTVCGEIVEKREHCGKMCEHHSGFAFFDNDVVNLSGGLFSAVLAISLSLILF